MRWPRAAPAACWTMRCGPPTRRKAHRKSPAPAGALTTVLSTSIKPKNGARHAFGSGWWWPETAWRKSHPMLLCRRLLRSALPSCAAATRPSRKSPTLPCSPCSAWAGCWAAGCGWHAVADWPGTLHCVALASLACCWRRPCCPTFRRGGLATPPPIPSAVSCFAMPPAYSVSLLAARCYWVCSLPWPRA